MYGVLHFGRLIKSTKRKHTNSPTPKIIRLTKSAGKIMMIIFFDRKILVYQYQKYEVYLSSQLEAVSPRTTVIG